LTGEKKSTSMAIPGRRWKQAAIPAQSQKINTNCLQNLGGILDEEKF